MKRSPMTHMSRTFTLPLGRFCDKSLCVPNRYELNYLWVCVAGWMTGNRPFFGSLQRKNTWVAVDGIQTASWLHTWLELQTNQRGFVWLWSNLSEHGWICFAFRQKQRVVHQIVSFPLEILYMERGHILLTVQSNLDSCNTSFSPARADTLAAQARTQSILLDC